VARILKPNESRKDDPPVTPSRVLYPGGILVQVNVVLWQLRPI
jgi:hypothetical protein